jgi:hypothetical protein
LHGHSLKFPQVTDDSAGDSRFKAIEQYFEVQWLQSATDIREYRNFSYEIEDNFSPMGLGKAGFIPEIVVFDYELSRNQGKELTLSQAEKQNIFPMYRLVNFLNQKDNLNRKVSKDLSPDDKENIRDTIEAELIARGTIPNRKDIHDCYKERFPEQFPPSIDLNDDNMGCFGGGLIAVQFRRHPCVGIPTTGKLLGNVEKSEAAYFEWLLHQELKGTFKEKGRSDPRWTDILCLGVKNLRNRIKELIQTGQASTSLSELMFLANGSLLNIESENFTLQSMYGTRNIALAGLFIDIKVEERSKAVSVWAQELLDIICPQSDEVKQAFKNCNTLLEAWSSQGFIERYTLSILYAQQERYLSEPKDEHQHNEWRLDEQEEEALAYLKQKAFRVNEANVEKTGASNVIEAGIYNICEFRILDCGKEKGHKATIKRLTIIFCIIELIQRHAKAMEKLTLKNTKERNNGITKDDKDIIEAMPNHDDLLLLLYPISQNPLVLPVHNSILPESKRKKDPREAWKISLTRDTGFDFDRDNLEPTLNDSEKRIFINYATTDCDEKFYPTWYINLLKK